MASTELESISKESLEVLELVRDKKHFLLSGGAGSGKTYSLVEVLTAVVNEYPSLNIGCITYTNAAVDEIEDRVSHRNLHVSTIHDFLWANIVHFQSDLKKTLIELINDPQVTKIKKHDDGSVSQNFFDHCEGIQYKEFLKISEGFISHDEVIILASRMFEKYEKLCSITKDKFPFIFVDEYQDTDPLVIKILLEHLEKSGKKNVVGFFGDSMQSIYPNTIGDLDTYTKIESPKVIEVKKPENRRNPLSVLKLANKIRNDGLTQRPSTDKLAPNMDKLGAVKLGDIKFLYSANVSSEQARKYLGWDFENSKQVKELSLTHSLIAVKAKFPNLMRIYDKDRIREYIRNKIRIPLEENASDYDTADKTLAEVIDHIGSPRPTQTQSVYINEYLTYYKLAESLPYDQISKLYVDKAHLLDDKKNYVGDENKPSSSRDDLIKHLFKIENCIRLYQSGLFNQFIKTTDYSIDSVEDKIKLNEAITSFVFNSSITIGEVIDLAHELGLVIKDDRLIQFSEERIFLYKQVCGVSYVEFRNVFDYLEGYLPFSTQHKIKGAEFENVLVVLDNGRWSNYNFKYMFEKNGSDSVRERSDKLFYVCCTRAMEKLAVFFPSPSRKTMNTAVSWFGEENVVNLDEVVTLE